MKRIHDHPTRAICLALALLASTATVACKRSPPVPTALRGTVSFVTPEVGCTMASPMMITSQGASYVLMPATDGVVRAYDPTDGSLEFSVSLPVTTGYVADVTAPPVLFDDSHLVVALQHVAGPNYGRLDHQVVVIDLEARALDPAFPTLTLGASLPDYSGTMTVPFLAANSFSRSALVHTSTADTTRGFAYVGFGNQRDIQPWHGWLFELNLDAWATGSTAQSAVLLTTPDTDCGVPGTSGSREMACGGGIWAPAGPEAHETPGSYELYVPTGNGLLDLNTSQYANTIMRTTRGLAFDPGCDAVACAAFDSADPARACLDSCTNLFVPRLMPGEPAVVPESGVCNGMTLLECYAALDWDLGANATARVSVPGGPDVMVLPAKDGAVYLFDANHFGTLYDRETVVAPCGTATDACYADWAGMMVTAPLIATVDGGPVVVVPSFMYDRTHPAGVVALRIVMRAGSPVLEPFWTAPTFDSPEAHARFRQHPSRAALVTVEGEPYVLVVDVASAGGHGTLLAVRLRDGAIAARVTLTGEGNRYSVPLVSGSRVFITSCVTNPPANGHLEAIDLARDPTIMLP